jgi:hypothetical protein
MVVRAPGSPLGLARFHLLGMDSLSNLLLRAPLGYLDHAPMLRFASDPGYL